MNWIPGDIFDAGGRGRRGAPSASSPCCSPEGAQFFGAAQTFCGCFPAPWSGIFLVTYGSVYSWSPMALYVLHALPEERKEMKGRWSLRWLWVRCMDAVAGGSCAQLCL